MNLDAISAMEMRNMVIFVALAAASAILLGLGAPLMRAGAKRSDPSMGAGLFGLMYTAGMCLVAGLFGKLPLLWTLDNGTLIRLAVCGVVTAFTWLCLYTALTGGGSVGRVMPIMNLSMVILLVTEHFLLGAPLGLWRTCCMVLILLGTVFMESRVSGKAKGMLWMLYAGLAALSYTGLTMLKDLWVVGVDETIFNLARGGVATALLWVFGLIRGKQRTMKQMTASAWICTPLAAICICASLLCEQLAALRGDLSVVAPVTLLSFAVALLGARIGLKERLSGAAAFGMVLVLLGMLAILMGF